MTKSAEAFRTISEVADDLGIPKHVLRFWEVKFTQIKPMKRGGGRRYYRPADLELLRGIRHLLHRDGYTIKGVQKILREHGVDAVKHIAAQGSPPVGPAVVAETADAKSAKQRPAPRKSRPTSMPSGESGPQPSLDPKDRERIINQAIAELQYCKALLKGEKPASADIERLRRTGGQ